MTNYKSMGGPELVTAFNAMVTEADGLGQNTVKNVKRFASPAAGVKRCEAMAAQLAVMRGGATAKPARVSKPEKKKETAARQTGAVAAIGARAGSKREKLLLTLEGSLGDQVPVKALIRALYGNNGGSKGALMMAIKGVKSTIAADRAKFEIKHVREGNETSYGLYKK